MEKFKRAINTVAGSILAYISVLFFALAINSPVLAIAGWLIVPVVMVGVNIKSNYNVKKYYLGLIGSVVVTFIMAGIFTDLNAHNSEDHDCQRKSIIEYIK